MRLSTKNLIKLSITSYQVAFCDVMALNQPYGCSHYHRKCNLMAPCCHKVYTCRFCHDDKENHQINRKAISELVCIICATRQKVQPFCRYCGVQFGKYTCLECNLFDDDDKGQFHCPKCGICRIGGRNNFFHCDKCDMCLSVGMRYGHKCIENRSHTDCPICLEDLHSSRIELHIPDCGHLLHKTCFEDLKKEGIVLCPLCKLPFKK